MRYRSPHLTVLNNNELTIHLDGVSDYTHVLEIILEVIQVKIQKDHPVHLGQSPYFNIISVCTHEIERPEQTGSPIFSRKIFIELLYALIAYETFASQDSGSALLRDAALSFEEHFEPSMPKVASWH